MTVRFDPKVSGALSLPSDVSSVEALLDVAIADKPAGKTNPAAIKALERLFKKGLAAKYFYQPGEVSKQIMGSKGGRADFPESFTIELIKASAKPHQPHARKPAAPVAQLKVNPDVIGEDFRITATPKPAEEKFYDLHRVFPIQVPSKPDQYWFSVGVGRSSLPALIADYAGVSENDAALWLDMTVQAANKFYGVDNKEISKEDVAQKAVEALRVGKLAVFANGLSDKAGKTILFGFNGE